MDNPSYLGIKYVTLWLLLSLVTGTCANGIVVGQSCSGVRPGTKFTNPENCRTYFGCNSGVYELEYCPSGFYNPQKNDCDLDFKCNQDNFPDVTSRPAVPTSVTWSTLMEEWISTTIDFEAFSTVSPTTRVGEVSTVASSTISESVETTTVSLTTTSSPMTTTEVAIDPNGCPLVDTDEPTYLNDKQNCEKWVFIIGGETQLILTGFRVISITGTTYAITPRRSKCDAFRACIGTQRRKCVITPKTSSVPETATATLVLSQSALQLADTPCHILRDASIS